MCRWLLVNRGSEQQTDSLRLSDTTVTGRWGLQASPHRRDSALYDLTSTQRSAIPSLGGRCISASVGRAAPPLCPSCGGGAIAPRSAVPPLPKCAETVLHSFSFPGPPPAASPGQPELQVCAQPPDTSCSIVELLFTLCKAAWLQPTGGPRCLAARNLLGVCRVCLRALRGRQGRPPRGPRDVCRSERRPPVGAAAPQAAGGAHRPTRRVATRECLLPCCCLLPCLMLSCRLCSRSHMSTQMGRLPLHICPCCRASHRSARGSSG